MLQSAYRNAPKPTRYVEGLTREQACAEFQRKVILIARRVYERLSSEASVQLDDLMSWGAIGLLEAFDRFDPSRGIKFSTYAEYRIRGAMYDALRTHDTFTRRRRQLARRVERSQDEARRKLGRQPSPEEVAEQMDVSLADYWHAVDRVKPVSHVSINDADPTGRPLLETLINDRAASPGEQLTAAEIRQHLHRAVISLPDRQRQCVQMYYGKDMSLAEIAAVYDVTVSRISQILSEARRKLRKRLAPLVDPSDLNLEPTA